ncbi:hypothetical protein AB0A74_20225 [Saccharothrix sp. NPDC042600]|uniref:hypothetical protein n=1 Tax=Saccharothrix TaxID=2071 RepID=UPI0033DC536C
MVFVEDGQSVGGFASEGADESFGVGVGSWASWWDLRDVGAGGGEGRVERGGELACPVADEESEVVYRVSEVHQ